MGNDDLFDKIVSKSATLRDICEGTSNAVIISTFEHQKWLYWNEEAENLFGRGFHTHSWSSLTPFQDELEKDMALAKGVVEKTYRGGARNYRIQKHYINVETGKNFYAHCEFFMLGQHVYNGERVHIFFGFIRELPESMDPETQADNTITVLKRRVKKPAIYTGITAAAALITAIATMLAEINSLKADKKEYTMEEVIRALHKQTIKQSNATNYYE